MKGKIFNIALALVLAFSLGAFVIPQGTARAVDDMTYDERYVSMDGIDNFGRDGSMAQPWRSITYAVSQLPYDDGNPDRINVLPADPLWYGGDYPENIVVDKPVTIKSTDGAAVTKINVSAQSPVPGAVIEICSSNVVIDGFYLAGAATGVDVHPPTPDMYIDNVHILNCTIKVDQFTDGVGIFMTKVKYPIIHNNEIFVGTMGNDLVLSVTNAWGIIMYDCFNAQIHHNLLNVHGDFMAVGIDMDMCPKSVVGVLLDGTPAPNTINVLAGLDVIGIGICVNESPLIDVNCNAVTVTASGNTWAIAFGIAIGNSDRSDVNINTVTIKTNVVGGNTTGFLIAEGIWMRKCHESNVKGNTVTVTGVGNVNDAAVTEVELDEKTAEELADVDELLLQTLGHPICPPQAVGLVCGISVKGSEYGMVSTNGVNVSLDLTDISASEEATTGSSVGVALGIAAKKSFMLKVMDNTGKVLSDVTSRVVAVDSSVEEVGLGSALSVALGITLCMSPGNVSGNDISAQGDLDILIQAAPAGTVEAGSALARFDSEVMSAIYQSLVETVQSEQIDVEISGDLPSVESFAHGGGLAAGIGVLVLFSDGTVINDNDPVTGTGNVIAELWSKESDDTDNATAFGGGLGLGAGIAVIDCRGVEVTDNSGVDGTGTADATVGAKHDPPAGIQYAEAIGGGAGVGIGILLVGLPQFVGEAEELPEGECWWDRPVVTGNEVTASGIADPVTVDAVDLIPSHESFACGKGLGLASGICAIFYPCILIEGNTVSAAGDAYVDIYAEAIHEFDPTSIGGAAGIGIGIGTVACMAAEIVDNTAVGQGTADAEVGATEKVKLVEAIGIGGSIGLGTGIFVFGCPFGTIEGNSEATGLGDAETDVIATSYIPLSDAYAFGLAHGIGKGICVSCSPWTNVIDCNTAAGEGTARVMASAMADFDYEGALGVAADMDITVELLMGHPGVVQYNSMVDATALGSNSGPVMVMDAGLFYMGFYPLSGQFNWWNHPTGPSGGGPGNGEPVIWVIDEVWYMPWLYVVHTDVLDEQIGKFGFAFHMEKGLNTLSTPIALEEYVVPSRQWQDIVANSSLENQVKFVDRWDPATQMWVGIAPTDTLDPLDALYIYMYEDCHWVILMVNSDSGHQYAMPSRELSAKWNLIGPNPLFGPPPFMPVDEALSSIEQTPTGLPGYTQVISPIVSGQEAWYYVPGMDNAPNMCKGRGYWLWMENPDTLAGFGFSPLPHKSGP